MSASNPFYERGMIRDPQRFFGRKRELQQIFERLAAMQSVSIVGERRIGKSSLLAMIAAAGPDRLGQDYEFYYIDLQRVESTADFLARGLEALKVKDGQTFRDFEKALEDRKVVLCLDEFEQAGDYSAEFFNVLRSLASTGHLALVTASQKKLADLASEGATTSPFFNIFTTLPLGPMDQSEAADLLTGLARPGQRDFSPAQITAAYKATQGNPWKLQLFGYYLYQTGGDVGQATALYQAELDNNLRPRASVAVKAEAVPNVVHTGSAAVPVSGVLLVIAAVIGFLSVLANFSVGVGVTVAIVFISLLIELGRFVQTLRRR